jgi:hypothetical protein
MEWLTFWNLCLVSRLTLEISAYRFSVVLSSIQYLHIALGSSVADNSSVSYD